MPLLLQLTWSEAFLYIITCLRINDILKAIYIYFEKILHIYVNINHIISYIYSALYLGVLIMGSYSCIENTLMTYSILLSVPNHHTVWLLWSRTWENTSCKIGPTKNSRINVNDLNIAEHIFNKNSDQLDIIINQPFIDTHYSCLNTFIYRLQEQKQ